MHERLRTGSLRMGSAEGSLGSAEGNLTDQVTIKCSATLKVGPCPELLTGSIESQTNHRCKRVATDRTATSASRDAESKRASRAQSQEGKGRDFRVTTFDHLCVAGPIGPMRPREQGGQHTMGSHRSQCVASAMATCALGR